MTSLDRRLLLIAVWCFILISRQIIVDGAAGEDMLLLTKEDELDIENQLTLLNKPSIKIIQTNHGVIYDCVDFYKQPAFDHPLLKNHTFRIPKTRPSIPNTTRRNLKLKSKQAKFTRVGCPDGTVPIRRVTKDDLIRAKLHEKKFDSHGRYGVLDAANLGFHYAVLRTKLNPSKGYSGGNAFISAYNVSVNHYNQFSTSRMRLQSGTDMIHVGIMTNPVIYNTVDTHLFIHTKSSQVDCFNMQCPGFVLVNKDLPVDPLVEPVTRKGGPIYTANFVVYKGLDENWWYDVGYPREKVGFWPSSMFDGGLNRLATTIDWGGEVSSPVDLPSPPMGSGTLPVGDDYQDAFCEFIKVRNEEQQEVEITDAETYADTTLYNVIEKGYTGSKNGHVVFFGGPGGALG